MRPTDIALLSALAGAATGQALVPAPQRCEIRSGPHLSVSGVDATDATLTATAAALAEDMTALVGSVATTPNAGRIVLRLEPGLVGEAYRVVIDKAAATVSGASPAAVAFGAATLLQLLDEMGTLPQATIDDAPAYPWRLLMLDVARRHHTVDEIRQQIQLCRFYKLRQLQLHLTDDQDFMFPSQRFRKLGADNPSGHPPYTRAELADLVAFARNRGVVLIPELDVPGHSTRLRRGHPEAFRAKDGRLDIDDETTLDALRALLDEICEVFPDAPIHIGCDESGVGTEALSTFITRMHAHLATRGRQTLIWEGFGRGGKVPADVLVMIWANAYQPAAEQLAHHRCLNGTWDPCYVVEHYPLDNLTYAPPARVLGWRTELFRDFERGGKEPAVEDARNVAGGFLCWWEGHGRNALPLLRRRSAALAERLWNPTATVDAAAFTRRLDALDARLDALLFPVHVAFDRALHVTPTVFQGLQGVSFAHAFRDATTVRLTAHRAGEIRVAIDDAPFVPAPADGLRITATTRLQVGLFADGAQVGRSRTVLLRRIDPVDGATNLALGRPVTTDAAEDPLHPAALLTDGNRERMAQCLRHPAPVTFTIDLQAEVEIAEIKVFAFHGGPDRERYVLATSPDGVSFEQVADRRAARQDEKGSADGDVHRFAPRRARYVQITSHGNTRFPGSMCRLTEVEVR